MTRDQQTMIAQDIFNKMLKTLIPEGAKEQDDDLRNRFQYLISDLNKSRFFSFSQLQTLQKLLSQ